MGAQTPAPAPGQRALDNQPQLARALPYRVRSRALCQIRLRKAFGGKAHDDAVARLRLKQAFGRLVRRADDRGVFVLLDSMMPSRLFGAFPDGVMPVRVGLKEAVEGVRKFLAAGSSIDL